MQDELEQTKESESPQESEGQPDATTGTVEAEVSEPVSEELPTSADDEAAERVPQKKTRVGLVVSDKMDKSVTVSVTRRIKHPLYKKYLYKSRKFVVHDEENECNEGDKVRIVECRPLSSRKRWTLDTIIERAK